VRKTFDSSITTSVEVFFRKRFFKKGLVEKIRPYKRNLTRKLVITIKIENSEEFYPGKVSEKSK